MKCSGGCCVDVCVCEAVCVSLQYLVPVWTFVSAVHLQSRLVLAERVKSVEQTTAALYLRRLRVPLTFCDQSDLCVWAHWRFFVWMMCSSQLYFTSHCVFVSTDLIDYYETHWYKYRAGYWQAVILNILIHHVTHVMCCDSHVWAGNKNSRQNHCTSL